MAAFSGKQTRKGHFLLQPEVSNNECGRPCAGPKIESRESPDSRLLSGCVARLEADVVLSAAAQVHEGRDRLPVGGDVVESRWQC